MGIFTKKIAKESETPTIVSLSSNANYIQFESLNNPKENKHINISLRIIGTKADVSKSALVIVEKESNSKHEFIGTEDGGEVNSTTFFIHDDKSVTAENIKTCLMSDSFFRSNFNITVPAINNNSVLENGDTIVIQSIGTGPSYAFTFESIDNAFFKLEGEPGDTTNNDTISEGALDCEIDLELYRDTDLFLGVDDTPQNDQPLGTYVASLTKAYFNKPIWFDLNALIGSSKVFSNDFLNVKGGWRNAGTVTDFRFIARRFDGVNRMPFYISNVLYAITGYERNLETNDLKEYIYSTQTNNKVKPLTKQPLLTHVKGQTQYFNFILADSDRDKNLGEGEYNLGIMYKLYTQSKQLIKTVVKHEQNRESFNVVNTIKLDIDGAIEGANVGYVEVCLCRAGEEISEPLTFTILPECLYKVNDFAFLNSVGGWSSFNFAGTETTDFKSSTNTIHKTQTPGHTISSEIESVYSKDIKEQFIAQTMPVNETVCNWLKELSSSIAVYELSTKRYVVVDEMNIKPNSKDELFRIDIKYHYSDSYNGLIG